MSTRNRERRKAKQQARERHRRDRVRHGPVPGVFTLHSVPEIAEALVADAVVALHDDDAEEFERC